MPTTSLDTTADAEGAAPAAAGAAGAAVAAASAAADGGQPGAAPGGATTPAEAQLTSTEELGGDVATEGANAEGGEGGGERVRCLFISARILRRLGRLRFVH